MKSTLLLLICLIAGYVGHTQPAWGWDVAGSAVYGKKIKTLGPQFRAYILVNEHLCFGPEFTWFNFDESDLGEKKNLNLYDVNFNGHYVFEVGHKFGIYPLAGLNWSKETTGKHSKEAFGINIGSGFHVFAGRWVPYIEYSYLISDLSDHKFIIGTYFIIRDIKKEERNH